MTNYAFQSLLKDPDFTQFSSFRHLDGRGGIKTVLPTAIEGGFHLLLLKAFNRLYLEVTHGKAKKDAQIIWKVYVTNAVRRFTIFISAFKYSRTLASSDESDIDYYLMFEEKAWRQNLLHKLLPPLDVIMIWHAFLLNPKTFYDMCARNKLVDFAFTPFPLLDVADAIEKETFAFRPSMEKYSGFQQLMDSFGMSMEYDVDPEALLGENVVRVYCPMCCKPISPSVAYTNAEGTGFADSGFLAKSIPNPECEVCSLLGSKTISHERLRLMQLHSDILKPKNFILPNCYKYFSPVISTTLYRADKVKIVDKLIKSTVSQHLDAFNDTKSVFDLLSKILYRIRLETQGGKQCEYINNIFRSYLHMNLVHLTVSSPQTVPVSCSDDLVGTVLRQQRFVDQINEIGWLQTSTIAESLSLSEARYKKFIELFAGRKGRMLIPTLDIELFWTTHLLSMYNYLRYCKDSLVDSIIDHYDKIEESRLLSCFEETSREYRSKYNEEYCLCPCWYCTSVRANSSRFPKRKIKKLFGKRPKGGYDRFGRHSFNHGEVSRDSIGVTHICTSSSIELHSQEAKKETSRYDNTEFAWLTHKIKTDDKSVNWVIPINEPYTQAELRFWPDGKGLIVTTGDGGEASETVGLQFSGTGGGPLNSFYIYTLGVPGTFT